MRTAYPIVITPEAEGGYVVYVPDLKINTQGETVAECMYMARDAISLWGICEQDMGRQIPPASEKLPECAGNEMATFVDVDFDAYRRTYEQRTVRKNVTLPAYLNELAEAAHVNFSQVLQEGLKQRLGVR